MFGLKLSEKMRDKESEIIRRELQVCIKHNLIKLKKEQKNKIVSFEIGITSSER